MFFQITNLKFTIIVGAYGKKTEKQLSRKSNMRRYQQNGISLSIQLTVNPHTGFEIKLTLRETVRPPFLLLKGLTKKKEKLINWIIA